MIALLRYLGSDLVRGQRWVAPLLCYLAAVAISAPGFGPVLPTYTISASALLPITLWLTIVVHHNEEPLQADITVVTVGSIARVRLAKLLTAFLTAAVFGFVAMLWISVSTGDRVTPAAVGVGGLVHLLCMLTGVAFGMLLSRPITQRMAWTVLLGVGVFLGQLLIPHVPPMNALLKLYNDERLPPTGSVLVVAVETIVLVGVLLVIGTALTNRRS